MKPDIGISKQNLQQIVSKLNVVLADEFVLYTKTRNFHWNVSGAHFVPLHELFEQQYDILAEAMDEVAERARMLGGNAIGTLEAFSQATRLREHPGKYPAAEQMVKELAEDHQALIRFLREDEQAVADLGDDGTNDFLIGLMQKHEKMAWMLRTILE